MTAASSSMLQVQQQRQQQELPSSTTTTTNGGDTTPQTDDSSSSTSGAALKKGPWTSSEDAILIDYVKKHGEGNWNAVQKNSGLSRCGKSCRLRWANHLRPNLKKGSFSPEEERLILQLHAKLGNKWARMAAQLPGRTDNEIKNYWNTRIKRRQRAGLPLYPADIQRQAAAVAAVLRHSSATTRSKPLFESLKLSPSLSFFDPLSHSSHFSTTPLLNQTPTFMPSPIHHQFKRFKEPPPFNFQQNPYSDFPSFSSNNFQLHQQQRQPLVFNDSSNGGLDLVVGRGGVPYKPPDPVHRGGLPLQSAAFSVKSELPSSQFAESVSSNTGSGAPIFDINNNDDTTPAADMPFSSSNLPQRNNSGLLDALLQEAEAMAGGSEGVGGGDQKSAMFPECVADKCSLDGWAQDDDPSHLLEDTIHWDDSISAHSSIGIKMKRESVEDGESVDEDFSALLDFMTPSMLPVSESECFIRDRAEMSNGEQSSAMIEDDVVKHEMQQPLSLSPADQVWDLGAYPWNNMPGIC